MLALKKGDRRIMQRRRRIRLSSRDLFPARPRTRGIVDPLPNGGYPVAAADLLDVRTNAVDRARSSSAAPYVQFDPHPADM